MTKRLRVSAAVLAALAAVVLLASSLFIVSHAEHDCAGRDCSVCEQMRVCAQALKTLSTAAAVTALCAVRGVSARAVSACAVPARAPSTPISLRVKLSN